MKITAFVVLLCLIGSTIKAQQKLPQPATGRIQRFESMPSKYVTPRHVDVWLPDGYSPTQRYAVLYMHDGEMLYDSTITWNHQEWGVDETLSRLMATRQVRDCIVVGVWNSGPGRHADYFPQKPFEMLTDAQQEQVSKALQQRGRSTDTFRPVSDQYLRFLVNELKPFIDKTFSTKSDVKNTFVAGSSMGGLISMYALCEYPKVFGGAACLSTHWPGIFSTDNNPIPDAFGGYLAKHLPKANTRKLYFDYGNQTLDALYPPLQQKVDAIMRRKGYGPTHWQTHFFDGADHSEKAWKERLALPLTFLMKP